MKVDKRQMGILLKKNKFERVKDNTGEIVWFKETETQFIEIRLLDEQIAITFGSEPTLYISVYDLIEPL